MIDKTNPAATITTSLQIDTDLNSSFVMDRTLADTLILPHDFDAISIKPNETVAADTINASLQQLYNNFLYLHSRTKLVNNNIPGEFSGVLMGPVTPKVVEKGNFRLSTRIVPPYIAHWIINDVANPTMTLHRGGLYVYKNIDSQPFWISTESNLSEISRIRETAIWEGITNNGSTGNITFHVPFDAPNKLYYYSGNEPARMAGSINIYDYATEDEKLAGQVCILPEPDPTPVDTFQVDVDYDTCPELNIPPLFLPLTSLSGADILKWSSTYTSNQHCQRSYLNNIRAAVAIDTDYGYGSLYLQVIATNKHLLVMESDLQDTVTVPREYTNKVEDVADLFFSNISDMVINSENTLYVADQTTCRIYQYEIDNLVSDNPVTRKRGKVLVNSIGGIGHNKSKDEFNDPIALAIGKNDTLYVLDYSPTGNSAIKSFDKNLNSTKVSVKITDFRVDGPVDMAVDPVTGKIHVLCKNGTLLVYDDDAYRTLVKKYNLTSDLATGSTEKFKKIIFSRENKNIVYIATTKSIIKKWTTRLDKKIGDFDLGKFDITDCTIDSLALYQGNFSTPTNIAGVTQDKILVGCHAGDFLECGKIVKLHDSSNYDSTVYDTYKKYVYQFDSIKIKPDEFVSYISLNRALLKLAYNHLLFRDNMHSKYSGFFKPTEEVIYEGLVYIRDDHVHLYNYELKPTDFIGINEIVLSETINRPLREIYELQLKLLEMLKPDYTNSYPLEGIPLLLR